MAIVKLGSLVVGIRGTVGGLTFSSSLSGANARLWSRGSNPRSQGQSQQRGRVGQQPEFWRGIDDAQRSAWAAFAADPAQELTNALGEPYYASGYAWFVKINTLLSGAGFAHRDDPPTTTRPAAPVIDVFTFEEVAGNFVCEIEYDVAEFPSGVGIVIEAVLVARGGRMVMYSGYRILISGIASPTGTYDFAINFAAQFGIPQFGDRAFLRVYKQDDEGLRGSMWSGFKTYT